jgi:PAS domain-containing protein
MPANPRSRYGILSAEILPASELLPLIDSMTLDEQIRVVGKLRALEVVLLERIMHEDKWHPHHAIISALTEQIQYRLRRRDGEYRWIIDSGVPRFNADGSFLVI